MALPKTTQPQTDFSAGELDVETKRTDDPALKIGARQAANMRILNSKKLANRSGRRVVMLETGRVEKVVMSPGNTFFLCFGANTIKVYNSAASLVFTQGGMPWVLNTVKNIVWDIYRQQIFIAFSGAAPQILSWDGTTWTLANFAEQSIGNQKRTPFYRLATAGITMLPSANSGAITLTMSANYFVAGMVGTRVRYNGRQILITGVTSPTLANATVQESLNGSTEFTFSTDPSLTFNVGDVVAGQTSGAQGQVAAFPGGNKMDVVVLTPIPFQYNAYVGPVYIPETIVGPAGSMNPTNLTRGAPLASPNWDEEIMNSYRGWPASVFVDQNRVGFCDFPSVPSGVCWSGIGLPTDLYPDPPGQITAANSIFELAPNKSRVLYVVAGPESSEFVFCDNGIYYIPISITNPLKPGSVQFSFLTRDGAAQVKPRAVASVLIYVGAGQTTVMSVLATGAQSRPYETRNLSDLHSHLINSPIAIAVPTSAGTFPERYAYILNGDGTVATLKYQETSGQLQGVIGWTPHSGNGTVGWVAALNAEVIFTSTYFTRSLVEVLDDSLYLDAALPVNSIPAALTPPGGKGPLWWIPSQTVTLMDLGTRQMGLYQIDANGFIIPQFIGGEDLASAQLVAGQAWSSTFEPFIQQNQGGQTVGQRMKRRKIARWAVTVQHSTGFVAGNTRVPTYRIGDDATLAPPQREETITGRQQGRDFDPRWLLTKDTAGPLTISEFAAEMTV